MSDVATDRVTLRLAPATRRQLRQLASRRGVSESEVVREALEEHLRANGKQLTCYELLRKAGSIGIIKDAPPDLATNPQHFDGFGSS